MVDRMYNSYLSLTLDREFAATYGYSAGDQNKLKVYAWPSLKCLIACPFPRGNSIEARAIFAVHTVRSDETGLLGGEDVIVASTDETVRFYKLFSVNRQHEWPALGLGGGRILQDEDLQLMQQLR